MLNIFLEFKYLNFSLLETGELVGIHPLEVGVKIINHSNSQFCLGTIIKIIKNLINFLILNIISNILKVCIEEILVSNIFFTVKLWLCIPKIMHQLINTATIQ